MIGTDWHIDPDDLARYADGQAGPAQLASVEAHLGRCSRCRAALSGRVAVGSAASTGDDPVWTGIADRIDGGHRLLRRWPRLATVSLASPPLMIATTLVAGLLVLLVIAARLWSARYATATLVTLGPITPLVAAHVAFGPRVDPAGRMAAAAPIASGRVAALRALAATLLACVAGLAVTPLTTLPAADVVVWLLPALAGTALAVAIGTFVDATAPSIVLALGWFLAVGVWLAGAPRALRGVTLDGLVSDRADVQIVLVVATVAAGVVALWRNDADPAWRRTS